MIMTRYNMDYYNYYVDVHNNITIIGEVTIYKDKMLGSGMFGCVFEGKCQEEPCAIKVLHVISTKVIMGLPSVPQQIEPKGVQEARLNSIKNECKSLLDLHHPNIVKLFCVCVYPKTTLPCLVMELLDCSLCNYLAQISGDLPLATQLSLSCNVGNALAYLHNHKPKPVIHRDLCGDNVLIQTGNGVPVAKIADFGMCRIFDPAKMTHSLSVLAHRSGYLPREGPSKEYNLSLDIHMFGAVMIQIVQAVENINSLDMREELLKKIPENHPLKKIIESCVAAAKDDRPTAETVHGQLKLLLETQYH